MKDLQVCNLSAFSSKFPCNFITNSTPEEWSHNSTAKAALNDSLARVDLYSRMCTLEASGVPFTAGLPASEYTFTHGLGNFTLVDLHGRRISVRVHGDHARLGDHGANHVILPGTLTELEALEGAGGSGRSPTPPERVALRIRKTLSTRCHRFWSSADLAITLSGGARAWPSLRAAGCCAYTPPAAAATSSASVRPLRRPFTIRPGLARAVESCGAAAAAAAAADGSVNPPARGRALEDDRACAISMLRATFASWRYLFEDPLRVQLREHYMTLLGNGHVTHSLKLGQFCQDPTDGTLCVCDVDNVHYDPGRFPTAPTSYGWAHSHQESYSHKWILEDAMHFLLRSLQKTPATSYVYVVVPELHLLAREVEARHKALEAHCSGILQLSFACGLERLPRTPRPG
jgi:hypothetical protein